LPDLVLLDMHLPDTTGQEIIHDLKADPLTARIPIVVVSADATAQQTDQALEAVARKYLTKPVSVHELLATVDETLEEIETRFG
jgi:CheY-like chemotaxis protein